MKETIKELLDAIDNCPAGDDFESKCLAFDIANKAIDAKEDIRNMVAAIERLLDSSAIVFAFNDPENYGDECIESIAFAEESLGYHTEEDN